MTRLERYREQLAKLEEKRNRLLKAGRYLQANDLNEMIKEAEELIRQAEEYENQTRSRPIRDLMSKKELNEMGIIPLMIECHLAADFLTEIAYMIVDICKEHGFSDVVLMPDLRELLKNSEKFASFLATLGPDLADLITRNETFNASLHKKYVKYIEQRLK